MERILELLIVICQATFGVLIICIFGIILARLKIVSREGCSVLSKLAFNCFLPSLLFTNISKSIEVDQLLLLLIIALYAFCYIIIGFISGTLVKCFMKPAPDFEGGTVAATTFGNAVTLPIALVTALDISKPFAGPNTLEQALSFISMYSVVSSAAQWAIGFNYLKYKAKRYKFDTETHKLLYEIPTAASSDWDMPDEELQTYSPKISVCSRFRKCCKVQLVKEIFERYLSPPVIANILGIIVGLTPIKWFLFDQSSYFQWLGHALNILGKAQVPVVLIILGINMAQIPKNACLKKRIIFSIVFLRLFIFPLIGIGLTELGVYVGLLPKNQPVLRFVLMLESGTPTAMNLVLMSYIVEMGEAKMAQLQFWVYVASIFSLTLYGTLYLYLSHQNFY